MKIKESPEQTSKTGVDEKALVNFREIKGGTIAPGILYRSGHPFRDGGIDKVISKLVKEAGIKCVLNLADEKIDPEETSIDAAWYDELAGEKKIICLGMDMINIPNPSFDKKLKRGLRFVISNSGPYLIHCFAGVDRTGFVSAVLEGLMGANMEEIFHDYALSYNDDGTESTEIILRFEQGDPYINGIISKNLEAMNRGLPVTDENIQSAIERYLLEDVGLSEIEILKLRSILAGVKGRTGGDGRINR